MNKKELIKKIGKENYTGFILFLLESVGSNVEKYYTDEWVGQFISSEFFLSPLEVDLNE